MFGKRNEMESNIFWGVKWKGMKINYFSTLIFFQAFKKENEGIMGTSIKFIPSISLQLVLD